LSKRHSQDKFESINAKGSYKSAIGECRLLMLGASPPSEYLAHINREEEFRNSSVSCLICALIGSPAGGFYAEKK